MKYKIIAHYNKENGHLKGYSIQYKYLPFIWIDYPFFHKDELFGKMEDAEWVLCWIMRIQGLLKEKDVFE